MATVIPFRGVRYNPERINGPFSAVVAPPYDVISIDDQDRLYKKSPHNVVRLILSRQYDGDGPGDNRYTRAAKQYTQWMGEGVLQEDPKPSYYVYEQTFSVGSTRHTQNFVRRGVLVALKLETLGQGCVFPHEETFSAPKADRLNLLRECRANLSPVFGLVPDLDRSLEKLLADASRTPPSAEVVEENGVINKLWAITDGAFTRSLTEQLAPRKVFIADGHHRYETALTYRQERMAKDSSLGTQRERPYEYVLMMCVPMSDPGLHILPTHRLVHSSSEFSEATFLSKLSELFERRLAGDAEILALAEERTGPVKFGVILNRQKMILTVKPAVETAMKTLAPSHTPEWRGLDVAVLHELILKGVLALSEEKVLRKEGVTYTKDAEEVLAKLSSGSEYQVGFVLRPTRIEQVCKVAELGEKMPHKSTYFYPKLLTGMVLRPV